MSGLDDKIDDLYRQPLDAFTAARNALAKSLGGAEAQRVKKLPKPTVVPWAVNQLYWRARGAYDRVMKSGEKLRTAQIAALEGKAADVRAAGEAHRRAIADAVGEAERLATSSGSKPSPDSLTRTLEALSLATEPPEAPGRLTEALQPAGFEALAGVTPSGKIAHGSRALTLQARGADGPERAAPGKNANSRSPIPNPDIARGARQAARDAREAERLRAEEAARDAAKRKREAELKKADAAVARAEAHEKLARETWERAHDALLDARRARDDIKRSSQGR